MLSPTDRPSSAVPIGVRMEIPPGTSGISLGYDRVRQNVSGGSSTWNRTVERRVTTDGGTSCSDRMSARSSSSSRYRAAGESGGRESSKASIRSRSCDDTMMDGFMVATPDRHSA
jgi:hypothetical protein